MRLESVDVAEPVSYLSICGVSILVKDLPHEVAEQPPYVRVVVYGVGTQLRVVGTCWIAGRGSVVPIVDSDGTTRGVLRFSKLGPGVAEPPFIAPEDRTLDWVQSIDSQPYPSFTIDNQLPIQWNANVFDLLTSRVSCRFRGRTVWSGMKEFIHVVSDISNNMNVREASTCNLYRNPLWDAFRPDRVVSRDQITHVILCTWYALRRVKSVDGDRSKLGMLKFTARRVHLLAAHCTRITDGLQFLCVMCASAKYIRSGRKAPGVAWDGSLRPLKSTLPPDTPLDAMRVDFMHCKRLPYTRLCVTPSSMNMLSHPETRVLAMQYNMGPWTRLAPLPCIAEPGLEAN